MVLRSPLRSVLTTIISPSLALMLLGTGGAIAQEPAPSSPTAPPNTVVEGTEGGDDPTAPETTAPETAEPDPSSPDAEAVDGSMLPGLDLNAPLRLWDAMDILNLSLERGLDIYCRFRGEQATAADIQQEGLTLPSLWLPQAWIGGKVVRDWYVYEAIVVADDPHAGELPWVELVINEQPWQNLDYLAQYRALQLVGRSALRFGYRLRVCNQRQQVMAVYACGLEGLGGEGQSPCRVVLRGGISARLNRNLFGF